MNYTDLSNNFLTKAKIEGFEDLVNISTIILNREISLSDIEDYTGSNLESVIRYWNRIDDEQNIPISERKPIKIFIDSYGGSLTSTFTIIDSMRLSKTPVYTIVTGKAYSGGFFIAINGHKRFTYKNAGFLFHEGSTGTGNMDAGKFRNYTEFYNKKIELLKQITLEKTKISEELYQKHKLDDWWIDANEAIELGICDEICSSFSFEGGKTE